MADGEFRSVNFHRGYSRSSSVHSIFINRLLILFLHILMQNKPKTQNANTELKLNRYWLKFTFIRRS